MYEPKDNDEYRKIYEPEGRGICGVSVIAVLEKTTIKEILDNWTGDYPGYVTLKSMINKLKELGYETKWRKGGKTTKFEPRLGKFILRIQWVGNEGGKWHGYSNWHDATCKTHWLLVDNNNVYCNSEGWFDIKHLEEYLSPNFFPDGKGGYITSYLEVEK